MSDNKNGRTRRMARNQQIFLRQQFVIVWTLIKSMYSDHSELNEHVGATLLGTLQPHTTQPILLAGTLHLGLQLLVVAGCGTANTEAALSLQNPS